MRLKPQVSLGFYASLPVKQNGDKNNVSDCIEKLFVQSQNLIVGGQQRVCSVCKDPGAIGSRLPKGGEISGNRVKWALLSPAIFPAIHSADGSNSQKDITPHSGGWLPTWVAENEQVLDGEKVEPGDVLSRDGPGVAKARRLGVNPGKRIRAKLVAACVPKPIVITGWTEALHLAADHEDRRKSGPRETKLAVPAGSVYYFEAENEEEAKKLAKALNWHGSNPESTTIQNRRSTLMGEKGFGLGVCGTWNFFGT